MDAETEFASMLQSLQGLPDIIPKTRHNESADTTKVGGSPLDFEEPMDEPNNEYNITINTIALPDGHEFAETCI